MFRNLEYYCVVGEFTRLTGARNHSWFKKKIGNKGRSSLLFKAQYGGRIHNISRAVASNTFFSVVTNAVMFTKLSSPPNVLVNTNFYLIGRLINWLLSSDWLISLHVGFGLILGLRRLVTPKAWSLPSWGGLEIQFHCISFAAAKIAQVAVGLDEAYQLTDPLSTDDSLAQFVP